MLKKLMATSNDVSFTILRVVLGTVFFAHGAQKMLGWFGDFGFHGTWDSLRTWECPLRPHF